MIHKFLYHTDCDLRREGEEAAACVQDIIHARRALSKRWAEGDLAAQLTQWHSELDSIKNDHWNEIVLRERGRFIEWNSYPCARTKLDSIRGLQNEISDTMRLTSFEDKEVLSTMWDLLEHSSDAINTILILDDSRQTIGDPAHKAAWDAAQQQQA